MSLKKRKVFYTDSGEIILASGIILVYENKLVMQYEYKKRANTKYLSDFGGKINFYDKNPLESAIREFTEETNGYLMYGKHLFNYSKNILNFYKKMLKNVIKSEYIKKGKYMLYYIKIDKFVYNRLLNLRYKYNENITEGLSHQIVIKEKINDDKEKIHPRLFDLYQK